MQVSKTFVSLALLVASASAVPMFNKRIAQTTIDSVQPWENACNAAGGGSQCNPIAVNAAAQLLAAADACGQQDSADAMVSLAKTLNNNADMITAAQIFAQQPRNSPNSLAVVYCQSAPQNQELNGLFQCQFQGSNQNSFTNGQAVGGTGTIPFGLSAPVNPLGSCPASPSGPVPDGQQLSDLVQSPGTPAASSTSPPPASSPSSSGASNSSSSDEGDTSFPPPQQSSGNSNNASGGSSSPSASSTASGSSSSAASSSSASGGFQLSNGQTAQSQNAGFAQLTPTSPCTEGEQACVDNGFAQCVSGQFVTTQCAGGTQCFALPLVNKAGTSIACTTQSDASSRIAATGATGGITGSGSSPASSSGTPPASSSSSTDNSGASSPQPAAASPSPSASASGSGGFQLSNGQQAQTQNAQFASLTASSSCTEGQDACVGGGFAQCVSGKFAVTQCAGGTQCFALPLVNKPGTSITCTTTSDATSRIAATGATGGITGSSS